MILELESSSLGIMHRITILTYCASKEMSSLG